eukprot:1380476-Prorocentrum_lima.AAC.1
MTSSLVGSEMCIRDSTTLANSGVSRMLRHIPLVASHASACYCQGHGLILETGNAVQIENGVSV